MSKVDTQHKLYSKFKDQWVKCRACAAGQRAVHEKKTLFLPMLKDQTMEEYDAYRLRTKFFNATWRTISALVGLLFRKPPVIEKPTSVDTLLEDVTQGGVDFFVFAQDVAEESLTTWTPGILVDFPAESTDGMTLDDAQARQIRPTMQIYPVESVINWKKSRINNAIVFSLVVLREEVDIASESEFENKTETRYRVLDLVTRKWNDEDRPRLIYRQRVFRIDDQQNDIQIGGEIIPLMNGAPLSFIPFYFESELEDPPLIDLVDVNLDHYRMSADYAHGLHFTGLPTPVVSGYTPEDKSEKLYIGSSSAWIFSNPEAKAVFLEFKGEGLGSLEKAIDRDEQQMAIIGARLLVSEKKDTETSQTAQIHRAGESSILSAIAKTLSILLTKAFNTFCEWAGSPGKWSVELNRDFMPIGMTPEELTALLAGWQMGAPGLSDEGLFNIFKDREMIRDDVTLEDEQSRISSKPLPGGGGVNE